jgi:hypothetical protein
VACSGMSKRSSSSNLWRVAGVSFVRVRIEQPHQRQMRIEFENQISLVLTHADQIPLAGTGTGGEGSLRASYAGVAGEVPAIAVVHLTAASEGLAAQVRPEKEVFSTQDALPGETMAVDWTAVASPVIAPSLSVNSFLPEAVISICSLARVMPT